LAPIDQIVGNWRQVVGARTAYRRLTALLKTYPPSTLGITLPRPQGRFAAQSASLYVPGLSRPILHEVNFVLEPGEALGIVGPSGAGKSTLARLIVGIHAPSAGVMRLDGADVAQWSRTDFGRHVGYLPQEIELFADTVASNIARFSNGNDDAVIAAAMLAGAHEMILEFPRGYETQVGPDGLGLSGGQRQRIALARALYGDPSLIVLDEPSSNLDIEGDIALANCLGQLKEMKRTVILISHRQTTLNLVDKILILQAGTMRLFGPRQEVLAKLGQPVSAAPLKRDVAYAASRRS